MFWTEARVDCPVVTCGSVAAPLVALVSVCTPQAQARAAQAGSSGAGGGRRQRRAAAGGSVAGGGRQQRGRRRAPEPAEDGRPAQSSCCAYRCAAVEGAPAPTRPALSPAHAAPRPAATARAPCTDLAHAQPPRPSSTRHPPLGRCHRPIAEVPRDWARGWRSEQPRGGSEWAWAGQALAHVHGATARVAMRAYSFPNGSLVCGKPCFSQLRNKSR